MIKLNEKCKVDRRIPLCDYIKNSPREISTICTVNSQTFIDIPRVGSVIPLLSSYLDLNFDVLHAATDNSFADATDIELVNLGPIALFSIS